MKRLTDKLAGVLLGVLLLATAMLLILPIIVAISMSFNGATYMTPFPPKSLSTQWYSSFFSDSYYIGGLKVSLLLAACATTVSTVAGTAVAFVLDRYQFAGKALLSSVFMSPLVIGGVVVGFSLLMFFSKLHVESGFLRLLGCHIVMTLPFCVRSSLSGLAGINRTFEEAALVLGASEGKAFRDVTLPLAKTGIIAGAIFAFATSMDEVAASVFLTTPKIYTLPIALVSMMRSNFDLTIAAAAVLLLALTVSLIVILDRLVGIDRVVGRGAYGG
ncbi:ABC transporter permease [Mesorhizobium australicum]|uniref:ABC transporter permease n=1 Tax=Mesorhizobium australicum TaxID=536018 RepID=UPI003339AC27